MKFSRNEYVPSFIKVHKMGYNFLKSSHGENFSLLGSNLRDNLLCPVEITAGEQAGKEERSVFLVIHNIFFIV